MLKRTLCICILIGSLLGEANSLSCFNCSTLTSCQNPSLQACNNEVAIINSYWLSTIYAGVSFINASDSFECLYLPYSAHIDNESTVLEFRGCVFRDIDICSLPQQSNRNVIDCHACNWNYCNRNSGSSFIKSNSIKLITSLTLITYKLLKCTL
ncbi:uncharacterized protein LOC132783565 [Drosophila nasuta]|uniref:uncharacterized protein LOC132783565 n=1 Tax=Drosophila nasuta TaxID=42062 RepID=UPI00295E7CB8|nr:uncharacterized protein LOC132783565 [Drosophila nasuta]